MIPSRHTEIQRIIVKIDDVDLNNRIAHARDKSNVLIQTSFRDAPGGVLHIPTQGERWVVQRMGYGPWYLTTKLDNLDEHSFVAESMAQGDTRLSADGALHMLLTTAYMNGQGIGYTVKDNFYSGSGWTSITLSSPPATVESICPFLDGLLIAPHLYRVEGQVVTFNTATGAGNLVVVYQVWQRALVDAGIVTGRAVISGADLYP